MAGGERGKLAGINRMKRENVYRALAFLFPFVVFLLACLNQPDVLGLWEDDGLYFQAAQGLAQNRGYRAFFFPGEPYQTVYPPLNSVLLALFMILGLIKNSEGFQIALPNIVFLSLASLVFYNFFRRRFPEVKPGTSLLLTWLVFFHPHLWDLVFLPMSEPLFILLYLLILWGFEKYHEDKNSSGFCLGIGFLLGLSLMTRTLSLSLVVGAMLWLLLQKEITWSLRLKKTLTLLFPAFVFYGVWNIYLRFAFSHNPSTANSILFTYYKAYSIRENQLLSFLPNVVVSNVINGFESAANLLPYALIKPLFLLQNKSWTLLFGTVFLGLFFMGIHSGIQKRGLRPEHLMFPIYLGIVFVWPFPPRRFLVALIPWFALLFADAFDGFRKHGKAIVVPLMLVLFLQGIGAGRFYFAVARQPISSFEFMGAPYDLSSTQEALNWMDAHLPREAVVVSTSTQMVYFHAHRKSVPPFDSSKLAPVFYPHTVEWAWSAPLKRENIEFIWKNQENIWKAFREVGATHLFFDEKVYSSSIGFIANMLLIKSHDSQLVRIYSNPTTAVFEIRY